MAEELPEELKLKLMKKLMKMRAEKTVEQTRSREGVDLEKLVWSKVSDDRAAELLKKTKTLYPEAYQGVIRILAYLIETKTVTELDGYTVYTILQRLGIPVKPDLRIRFVKHGKEVDFKEYVGD